MKRWAIKAGDRTFYVYAPTANEAAIKLAANADNIGIKRTSLSPAMPAGYWDEKRGRTIDRDAIILEDNRRAPGA